jgi:hypothetical protein
VRWDRSILGIALPVAAVAIIAGVVSYSHIVALGLATGQSPADAHLLPFAVDGLIVSGSVLLIYGSPLGWLCVAPRIVATIYANVMSGVGHGPLAATVAAWPAAAFALASFTLERWLKNRAQPAPATDGPCGHDPVGTLDEAVVRAYVHGRDCLGQAPSQRHLAEVFNVSRPKVAALVGPLNGHSPELSFPETP